MISLHYLFILSIQNFKQLQIWTKLCLPPLPQRLLQGKQCASPYFRRLDFHFVWKICLKRVCAYRLSTSLRSMTLYIPLHHHPRGVIPYPSLAYGVPTNPNIPFPWKLYYPFLGATLKLAASSHMFITPFCSRSWYPRWICLLSARRSLTHELY